MNVEEEVEAYICSTGFYNISVYGPLKGRSHRLRKQKTKHSNAKLQHLPPWEEVAVLYVQKVRPTDQKYQCTQITNVQVW